MYSVPQHEHEIVPSVEYLITNVAMFDEFYKQNPVLCHINLSNSWLSENVATRTWKTLEVLD